MIHSYSGNGRDSRDRLYCPSDYSTSPAGFKDANKELGLEEVVFQTANRSLKKWESIGNTELKMEFWIDPFLRMAPNLS